MLEEHLGTTLFARGRDGVTAAESAEALLPLAEEIELAMARFTRTTEALEHDVAGLVRLTCPPDLAEVIVAPLLGEILAHHPALRVELDPGEAVMDLTRREADIALRTVRPSRGDLVVTRLRSVRWVLVATPALARALGTLRAWSDARWVGWGERLATSTGSSRWLAKHAPRVEAVVRSDSFRMQLAMLASGVGIGFVPEPSAAHYGLVPVELGRGLRASAAEWPVDDLYLVTHRALRDVPRVRVLWELFASRLGDRPRKGRS